VRYHFPECLGPDKLTFDITVAKHTGLTGLTVRDVCITQFGQLLGSRLTKRILPVEKINGKGTLWHQSID